MSRAPLQPAEFTFTDGVPYSEAFGDVYHSADGGLEQARHVFLYGNRLPERWQGRRSFHILETGFGLGLNFLATWQAWRADPKRSERLHYVAIEKHPFRVEDLAQLHTLWPELTQLSEALRATWPPLVAGFHRLLLDEGRVVLTLVFGDVADCLPQIEAAADAFYLDGFAPSKNPDMWSPEVLLRLKRLAAPDSTLATYTIAGAVRRALAQAGFVWTKEAGFGRKPEMLTARFAPRWAQQMRSAPNERHAIVIGAGIAGSAACERLAGRGWRVSLIERHAKPAQEASSNLAGITMPLLSRDDNVASRLARAAYLFSMQVWQSLGGIGHAFAGERCGVLQLARNEAHAELQRAIVREQNLPPDFVRWLPAPEVTALTGNASALGGWLFTQGAWLTPSSLCAAMLAACGANLEQHFGREVAKIQRDGNLWCIHDADGALIAKAPVLIFAQGAGATAPDSSLPTHGLPLSAIRGQVSHLPANALSPPPVVLCGEGYVTPAVQGLCVVGASYDIDDPEIGLRENSHHENLQRLAQVLPQTTGLQSTLSGRVGFRCVAPDRLPLVGALPDVAAAIAGSRLRDVPRVPGVYGLLGYASRGLIWASFAAELLASSLEGEALPAERELVEALDPARFALKAWRRSA